VDESLGSHRDTPEKHEDGQPERRTEALEEDIRRYLKVDGSKVDEVEFEWTNLEDCI
jgi:hypothetical protein